MSLQQLNELLNFGKEEFQFFTRELRRSDLTTVERAAINRFRNDLADSLQRLKERIAERVAG